MTVPNTQAPALTADALHWFTIRGAYRVDIQNAMAGGGGAPSTPAGSACSPAPLYTCNYLNEAFTNVDQFNPEKQPGSWPPSDALNQQVAQGFSTQLPASTTIPLQLQSNTLESYRRQLLHKKWRKCHHLSAVSASLAQELRSQDEIERLLLGQHVGVTTVPAA